MSQASKLRSVASAWSATMPFELEATAIVDCIVCVVFLALVLWRLERQMGQHQGIHEVGLHRRQQAQHVLEASEEVHRFAQCRSVQGEIALQDSTRS